MTLIRHDNEFLSEDEWEELNHLRKAIGYNISQVHHTKMEKFTDYFVRTLKEKGV